MRLLALLLALFALVPAAWAGDVTFNAGDGTRLHAAWSPVPQATRGVVLVHGDGGSAADWKFLAQRLHGLGIPVLALDLRGHGGSGAGRPLADADYLAMVDDVTAAVAWLRAAGVPQVHLVGAELGANLVLEAAARDPEVKSVALLTPGMQVRGVRVDTAIPRLSQRPLLVVVSREDAYTAKTALFIDSQARGPKHLQLYDGAGKGTAMLNREPALEGLLVSWLMDTRGLAPGQEPGPADFKVIDEGAPIETDGPRLPGR